MELAVHTYQVLCFYEHTYYGVDIFYNIISINDTDSSMSFPGSMDVINYNCAEQFHENNKANSFGKIEFAVSPGKKFYRKKIY